MVSFTFFIIPIQEVCAPPPPPRCALYSLYLPLNSRGSISVALFHHRLFRATVCTGTLHIVSIASQVEHVRNVVGQHARWWFVFFLAAQAAATETVPNTNPIRRILKRIGSRIDSISGASGDESDSRQVPPRENTAIVGSWIVTQGWVFVKRMETFRR